jgi:hypothetical protein
MQIKTHIAISESGVLFNGATGDSFSVNPIAAEVLEMVKGNMTKDQIKIKLQEKYDVLPERLDGDLYDFLAHLRQLNLIEFDE